MAHKVILPPKKNYIPQFLKQRDINSYFDYPMVNSQIRKKELLQSKVPVGTGLSCNGYLQGDKKTTAGCAKNLLYSDELSKSTV